MENLFASFNHPDSIAFLLSVLISFLIGFVTAWILWGGRAARYRREAESWKATYNALQTEHATLREQLDLKDADIARLQRDIDEANRIVQNIQADRAKWQFDLDQAHEENAKLQVNLHSYAATVDDLNNQILGLKARTAQLTKEAEKEGEAIEQVAQMQSSYNATLSRLNALEEKIGQLANENAALKASSEATGKIDAVQHAYEEAANRLALLETKLGALASENEALKTELVSLKEVHTTVLEVSPTTSTSEPDDDNDENGNGTPAGNAFSAQDAVLAALGDKIPAATEADKDDLTMIKGIGTFIEKKLNRLGIYTYEQISLFDEDLTDKVTAAIEFFPGRIQRDDWVGQASRLLTIKAENPIALQPSAVFPKNPQDLKIVEGIGPKIEKLLKKAGIKTLSDLADTSEVRLREILEAGGDAYRMHDPTTWPQQADLASKGQWDKLKEYQEYLVGGRDVSG
jgi:predicted flap endonuclease-1-like 5' DNA nuclease/peptidoglycan hydrolase CwlO-like protein